ncbi:MAG: penicillin-insensitive murein endopeptidase [Rhizobiales bacterium]|nr:penicillin-insensitive murein endopeptidase [Hyphomicrobiales bacterium]
MRRTSRHLIRLLATGLCLAQLAGQGLAETRPAKELFGGAKLPSQGQSAPFGSYAKGCMGGAVALPTDGPTWQAMRLSRNRRWGNPEMISLLERFSKDAASLGWGTGILVGDISQPRGGPMLFGHASHQIGLDADVWFTPKPAEPLSPQQREEMPFTSMLDKSKFLTVDTRRWSDTHARVVMQAASYPQVERVFVNPAIKKKLCETWRGDRSNLGKVRPIYGHDEHFHIRIGCTEGATGCKPQAAVGAGDGCDKSLAWWFTDEPWAKPKTDPNAKPVKPRQVMLSDLPRACAAVLAAPANVAGQEMVAAYSAAGAVPVPAQNIEAIIANAQSLPEIGPLPRPRPFD